MRKFAILISTILSLSAFCSEASAMDPELYAGASLGNFDLHYGPAPNIGSNPQEMEAGWLIGGGLYWDVPNNFEVGVDLMYLSQDYENIIQTANGATLNSTSIMANSRWVSPGGNFYAGAGLGLINIEYKDPNASFLDGNEWKSGYQFEAGLRANTTPIDYFAAIKFQESFDMAVIQNEYVEYKSLSLVAGIRF